MIKAAIMYSKGSNTVTIEATAKTLFALLDELQQVDYEYTGDGYKFRDASIMRICEREN